MKNITNKILITISISYLLFILPSCSNWLEEDTRGTHVMEQYYSDQTALEGGLVGIYGGLQQIFSNSSLGLGAVGTDESYTTRLTSNIGPLDQYTHNPNTDIIGNWYSRHYDVIQRANILLSRGPNTPNVSENDMNRILGEARFLRAWSYFRLVQAFGKIPLVLEETKEFNYYKKRDEIEDVYNLIIEDLKYASENNILPKAKDGGHANHWAAKALLAKVYLTLGTSMERNPQPIPDYSKMKFDSKELIQMSLDLSDDIIKNGGFRLLDKYGDVFLVSNKNKNSESIWEIQFSVEPGYGSQWSKQHGVFGNGAPNIHTLNAVVGTTAYQPVPSFYRYYKLGDERRAWNIADWHVNYSGVIISKVNLNGVDMGDGRLINLNSDDPDLLKASLEAQITGTRLGLSKYRWGDNSGEPDPDLWWDKPMTYNQANSPNNVIVLRFADVLLMRVEADMRLNGIASERSLSLMNDQIIARSRGINPVTGVWYTEAEMEDKVMEKYQAEIDQIQQNINDNPGDQSLQEQLNKALAARDAAKMRLLTNYTATTLTADEVLTQRACELCFEFHRWFDLVRTGKLKELVEARITDPAASPHVTVQENKHYLFPIPQKEIDMALDKANFAQNPNY